MRGGLPRRTSSTLGALRVRSITTAPTPSTGARTVLPVSSLMAVPAIEATAPDGSGRRARNRETRASALRLAGGALRVAGGLHEQLVAAEVEVARHHHRPVEVAG